MWNWRQAGKHRDTGITRNIQQQTDKDKVKTQGLNRVVAAGVLMRHGWTDQRQ